MNMYSEAEMFKQLISLAVKKGWNPGGMRFDCVQYTNQEKAYVWTGTIERYKLMKQNGYLPENHLLEPRVYDIEPFSIIFDHNFAEKLIGNDYLEILKLAVVSKIPVNFLYGYMSSELPVDNYFNDRVGKS